MKKGIFLAAAMLLVSFSLSAQTTACEWLTKLDKTLGDRYATYMTVATPESETLNAHSSILAWKIPWTEDPGGLQSMVRKESDTTEHTCTYNF